VRDVDGNRTEQSARASVFVAIETGDLSVFDEIVVQDYNDHLAGRCLDARP